MRRLQEKCVNGQDGLSCQGLQLGSASLGSVVLTLLLGEVFGAILAEYLHILAKEQRF